MSHDHHHSPHSPVTSPASASSAASAAMVAATQQAAMMSLTAKPHAFGGSVLTPKHARELTPSLVLAITAALSEQASQPHPHPGSGGAGHPPTPSGMSTPSERRASSSSQNINAATNAAAHAAFRSIQTAASSDTLGQSSVVSASGGAAGTSGSPHHHRNHHGSGTSSSGSNRSFMAGGVQYTVWITEAWRVLGWAEPSAALFWEMATMYHTLHVAARSLQLQDAVASRGGGGGAGGGERNRAESGGGSDGGAAAGGGAAGAGAASAAGGGGPGEIPPILSCGSTSSLGSARSSSHRQRKHSDGESLLSAPPTPTHGSDASPGRGSGRPGSPRFSSASSVSSGDGIGNNLATGGGKGSGEGGGRKSSSSTGGGGGSGQHAQQPKSTAASAKELPVWLIGTYLLLHCEGEAYRRNVSGEDERRFRGEVGVAGTAVAAAVGGGSIIPSNPLARAPGGGGAAAGGGPVDFNALLLHPSLSPRTRIHAGQHTDNTNCTAYLLRHLRKFLLLCAVPHNSDAVWAITEIADRPQHDPEYADYRRDPSTRPGGSLLFLSQPAPKPDADQLRRKHEEDHGSIGLDLRLTQEDLERLNLVLQAPMGGLIDDPPLRIGDFIQSAVAESSPQQPRQQQGGAPGGAGAPAGMLLADVEREVRAHLENELQDGDEDDVSQSSDPAEAMAGLSIRDPGLHHHVGELASSPDSEGKVAGRPKVPSRRKLQELQEQQQGYHKELSYTNLRGTTILLKPNSHPDNREPPLSSGASVTSSGGGGGGSTAGVAANSRLHDLHVSDCSDAHMYLLQPFEHATIAACTGCTIVVGAVAGLLHVVDCERTTITSAARRVLVSNCFDVLHCVFTPSPPLLVGDNRSCQFAPYNTYYDGLREDLLATGLAAALVNADGSNYGADVPQPALQCASNKWKGPVEVAKLEIPQLPPSTLTPTGGGTQAAGGVGADDKAVSKTSDDTMQTPILLPPSEFHILFVPLETETARAKRLQEEAKEMVEPNPEDADAESAAGESASSGGGGGDGGSKAPIKRSNSTGLDSQYCRILADVLQFSPFRLPSDYERRALVKAERMRTLQTAMQTDLTPEQQMSLEEELNRGFRDWLVTSGNLRQVLDLVHMERKGGV